MENLEFRKYRIARVLSVRKLSTAHLLPGITHYNTPLHQHSSWEFVFCEHGRVTACTDVEEYVLKDSQIVFHPPGYNHRIEVGGEETTLFVMSFVCTSKMIKLFQNQLLDVNSEQHRLLTLIIQELYNAFELSDGKLMLDDFHPSSNAPLGSEQMVSCYLESLLISLLRTAAAQPASNTVMPRIEERIGSAIKEYIDRHLDEQITLDILSTRFHYSRSYITSQFRNHMGMSIMEYTSHLRIERAKQLLLGGEMSVSRVADSVGYSSLPYFSQCFKKAVGCCPSEYMEKQIPFSA